jgi:hypothetical protein
LHAISIDEALALFPRATTVLISRIVHHLFNPGTGSLLMEEANSLRELDEPSAALRMLIELSKGQQRHSIGELYATMYALGVGRTAFNSSRRALIRADLAWEDKEKGTNNRTYTVLSITSRGMKVASKLGEIQALMSRTP